VKKVLFVVPHLSTGGLPQYTLSLIKKIKDDFDVYCIEYDMIADVFVVQRKQIVNLLGNKFYALRGNGDRLQSIIDEINPDVIHLQELPEFFIPKNVANTLYNPERKYTIIETSHDSSFDVASKLYFPDKFALISEYQRSRFSELKIPISIIEADIEYKERVDRTEGLKKLGLDPNLKHILNVGLFTPRKNQAEIFDYARSMVDYPVQFHFIGNQAGNFQDYWKPLMDSCPANVKIWGERGDVDNFYSCMDLFLFTSRGTNNDKETSPLVIREAIGYGIPSLIYNLPVYLNMYDKYDCIHYLDFNNLHENTKSICDMIGLNYDKEIIKQELFTFVFDSSENKIQINYKDTPRIDTKVSIRDIDSKVPIYWFDAVFHDNNTYWTIPTPKRVYDFMEDDTFRGFEIEFYTTDNELIYSKELYIKDVPKKRNTVLNLDNPFDCIFFNYNEMFVNGQYDCYGIKNLETVFDIGANNGLFTLYLLQNGCKKVYAFEPNESTEKNINAILHNYDNYELIKKAVYSHDNGLTFYTSETNTTIGSISRDHVVAQGFAVESKVPSISLNTFIKENNIKKIDLIKMDIEGSEYDVIHNLEDYIFDMTDSFLIEYHSNKDGIAKKLIDKIVSHGFIVDQIRNQSSHTNDDITLNYENSPVGTIYLRKKINNKIKAVQFLLNTSSEKQEKSIKNISEIQTIGIKYEGHFNDLYVDMPPVSRSNRPDDVSMELKENSLTPAHYGCYESFKNAVISEFDNDLDALIVFEGDAKIIDLNKFNELINESIKLFENQSVDLISFGGPYDLENGVLQSKVHKKLSDNFFISDRVIGCQCIVIGKHFRKKIIKLLLNEKWDALDLYLTNITNSNDIKLGISNKTIVSQFDGKSDIDGYDKKFKEFVV
jgi:FkbM family methyltransferase